MSVFTEALRRIADRVPETRLLMIMGSDGIPVERYVSGSDTNLEAVAAEYTTLLRASLAAAADTDLGQLLEVTVVNDRMTALMVAITVDYFVFAALAPGASLGRARYALRMAGLNLESEFR
jgi:predicted regulator of Ras-like GTPase activity (Roadblock/LC7/MglB family)